MNGTVFNEEIKKELDKDNPSNNNSINNNAIEKNNIPKEIINKKMSKKEEENENVKEFLIEDSSQKKNNNNTNDDEIISYQNRLTHQSLQIENTVSLKNYKQSEQDIKDDKLNDSLRRKLELCDKIDNKQNINHKELNEGLDADIALPPPREKCCQYCLIF